MKRHHLSKHLFLSSFILFILLWVIFWLTNEFSTEITLFLFAVR